MNDAEWRGSEEDRDPRRSYMRLHMPKGPEGLTIEDVDLVFSNWGQNYQSDERGRIRLVELKVGAEQTNSSQLYMLGLLNEMCQTSALSERYLGFFFVWTSTKNWLEEETFTVNGFDLTKDQFHRWVEMKLYIEPHNFRFTPKNIWQWHREFIES